MKVKDVMTEVQAEIREDRKKRVKRIVKEKQLELDAAEKVYNRLKDDMTALLDKDMDDFVFPHDTQINGSMITAGAIICG